MKKIVRHFSRATVICLEIAGVVSLVLVLAWLGLLWRLSQGPLTITPYLTTRIEQAFDRDIEGFKFKLGGAQMIWGGRFQPFEIEMDKLAVTRDDATPVLAIKRLRVQLSKRNLVFGRIVPRVIRLYGPALAVIRQEDGKFALNLGDEDEVPKPIVEEPLPALPKPPEILPSQESRQQLVRGILDLLRERSGLGMLDGLQEINISDAKLLYEDRIMQVRWMSRDADVAVSRTSKGLAANAQMSLDMGGNARASVRAEIKYNWQTRRTGALFALTGFNPAGLAQESESLKILTGINMPVTSSVTLSLDPDFRPSTARFVIGGKNGTFNAMDLYPEPLPVKNLFMQGSFDAATGTGDITQLKLDIGNDADPKKNPQAALTAKVVTEEGGVRVATVAGTLINTPMDDLHKYWPAALAPDPRAWVTTRLTKGIAHNATIAMVLAYDANAEKKVAVRSLGGEIDFTGIDVNYLNTMPPVLDVDGHAVYDRTSFKMDLTGGKLLDMKVGKSKVNITDLDKIGNGGHSQIEVISNAEGALKSALKVIDSKPLEYPEKLGIKSAEVEGKTKVDLTLKFPIKKSLTLPEIRIDAKADLNDVKLKDIVAGLDLTGGPMELDVNNDRLKVKGKGELGGMPATFDWLKNFTPGAAVSMTVKAKATLDAPGLAAFGVPAVMGVSGHLPADIDYTLKSDKSAVLVLDGDAKPFGFKLDIIDFAKPEGNDGKIGLTLSLAAGKVRKISGLSLTGAGLSMKGDIDFGDDGKGAVEVTKASLREFNFGDTSVAVEIESKGGGYNIRATGRQIDASALFKENNKPGDDAEAARQTAPIRLNLSAARMITGKDRGLDNVRIVLVKNAWKRIDQLELDAKSGKGKITLRYLPAGKAHTLSFEASDAGTALAALGLTKSIKGGSLIINGRPHPQGGSRDMVGSASLNNFKINDAPVIAKLLNALSLVGIMQLMSNDGLAFKKARVDFVWLDKGQPQQPQNVRLLKLKDGKTFGSSLGLTFEGSIDNWKNVYNLEGTIVPASGVSKFLNIIPIVGTILTAGGEGIFAATYTIKGTKADPVVSVNPLAALAPGILRKIFFE